MENDSVSQDNMKGMASLGVSRSGFVLVLVRNARVSD